MEENTILIPRGMRAWQLLGLVRTSSRPEVGQYRVGGLVMLPCTLTSVPPTLRTPVDTCLGNKSSFTFNPQCVTDENESILIGLGAALGLSLLGIRPPGLN